MDEQDLDDKLVCHDCIGEPHLCGQIEMHGAIGKCSYCAAEDMPTFRLEQIADEVERVFAHSWALTANQPDGYEYALMRDPEISYDWDRAGSAPVDVVEEIAQVSSDIASDIVSLLDSRSFHDPRDPDYEAPFGSEARYDPISDRDDAFDSDWSEMRRELHHRARFFNKPLAVFLGGLFAGIHDVKGKSGPSIRTLRAAGEGASVLFRARLALSRAGVEEVLSGIPNSMGAPSGRKVRAGRMNAAGVAVFYGALEAETCLAEVRPPVGSSVVMGKFDLLRDVSVLDLQALEDAFDDTSPFHPDFVHVRRRTSFLRTLSARFSAPVLPGAEEFDYLLTQAVCEYLANAVEPRIDGIAFRSAQRGGDGTNVTLFPRASLVQDGGYVKGTTVSASHSGGHPDDDDQSFDVWVESPDQPAPSDSAFDDDDWGQVADDFLGPADSDGLRELTRTPTLRLAVDQLQVIEIGAVLYSQTPVPVCYHAGPKPTWKF